MSPTRFGGIVGIYFFLKDFCFFKPFFLIVFFLIVFFFRVFLPFLSRPGPNGNGALATALVGLELALFFFFFSMPGPKEGICGGHESCLAKDVVKIMREVEFECKYLSMNAEIEVSTPSVLSLISAFLFPSFATSFYVTLPIQPVFNSQSANRRICLPSPTGDLRPELPTRPSHHTNLRNTHVDA